jgi:uncharacterized protein (TIGR02266 family)
MDDTRRDKRAPLSLKVRFKSANLDEFREQYSIDLSRGGLFIKSKSPMAVGTLLKFEFQLKDKSRLIHGVGRVVWVRSVEQASEAAPPGMGIKFIKMDAESRALVQEIVEARGDAPGRFDQGAEPEPEPEQASIVFPEGDPPNQVPLEDRTAVRHASEFLATALAAGQGDASAEAARIAEEARRRTEALEAAAPKAPSEPPPRASSERPAAAAPELPAVEPKAPSAEPEPSAAPVEAAPKPSSVRPAAASPKAPEPSRSTSPVAWVIALALLAGGGYVGARQLGALPGGPLFGGEAQPPEPVAVAEPPEAQPVAVAAEPAAPVVDAGAEGPEDEAEAIPAEPVPTVEVRVESNPRGAEIHFGDALLGTTPSVVQLPLGQPVALRIKAPRFVEQTVELTPEEHTRPVRVTLAELPYVVRIESTPSGAQARIWGQTTVTPGEITLSSPPANIVLRVSLRGYRSEVRNLARADFEESGSAMREDVQVSLEQGRAPTPARDEAAEPASPRPASPEAAEPAAPAEAPAPAPAAAPAAPEPAAAPAPAAAPEPPQAAPSPSLPEL